MKPTQAIGLIQNLLDQLKARRNGELPVDKQTGMDAIAIPDYKGKEVFLSFDGDSVGNKVAMAEEKDDEQLLAEVSSKINQGQDVFSKFIVNHGGKIIEAGGDEGLGKCNSKCLEDVEKFREDYYKLVGATVTVGVGEKISESTNARMLGKLKGKNQTIFFDENTMQEIADLKAQNSEEAQKLNAGGLIGQDVTQEPKQPPQDETQSPVSQESQQEPKQTSQDVTQEQEPGDSEPDHKDVVVHGNEPDDREIVEEDEPSDPTDLNFGDEKEKRSRERYRRHHKIAQKTAKQTGEDPDFLRRVSLALTRGK